MSAAGGVRLGWRDNCPGEARGLITLDGRPERLFVLRDGDSLPRLGQRFGARVIAVSGRLGLARLDIGCGEVATMRLRGQPPAVGERMTVDVVAEPARGKPAGVRRTQDTGTAPPGALGPAPTLDDRFSALGVSTWEAGEDARERIDEAQAQALAITHEVGQGVVLTVEPTRALIAVDVDLAETGAPVSVARANALALTATARLLRLKALGGLVAIDLIGFPKDGKDLVVVAREAFAPDGPEVHVAFPSRFGVMELAKPHGRQPLHEQLLDPDGRATVRTAAQAVVRALERQGRFEPGARLVATCAPEVAAVAAPLVDTLGPRFLVRAELGRPREPPDIRLL